MKQGGTVVFDTRDAVRGAPGDNGGAAGRRVSDLRELLFDLDVPSSSRCGASTC